MKRQGELGKGWRGVALAAFLPLFGCPLMGCFGDDYGPEDDLDDAEVSEEITVGESDGVEVEPIEVPGFDPAEEELGLNEVAYKESAPGGDRMEEPLPWPSEPDPDPNPNPDDPYKNLFDP